MAEFHAQAGRLTLAQRLDQLANREHDDEYRKKLLAAARVVRDLERDGTITLS